MGTSYGQRIVNEPRIILRALAISLELGIMVTIKEAATDAYPTTRMCSRWINYSQSRSHAYGTIVYVGARSDGSEEVLFYASSR
jgi:hypothetical protein